MPTPAWLPMPEDDEDQPVALLDLTDARRAEIADAIRVLLRAVGEDPERDGLLKTPQRVARMYEELLAGYSQNLDTLLNDALFDVDYDEGELITVAGISFSSLCEHHMLPFTGTAHVAYMPKGKVVGLSKIPRVVDMFARRLQVQERLTGQIADALTQALDPRGVMVMVEGAHSCCSLRGVKKQGVNMVTTARRGAFREQGELREAFYRQVGR
ncbi:MAG: GTP cyclohydrolase I FolE [Ardenticatenia bacterium]|nr:GTP cyclohydrolase I FolE [Ardenticatenia bacterium]